MRGIADGEPIVLKGPALPFGHEGALRLCRRVVAAEDRGTPEKEDEQDPRKSQIRDQAGLSGQAGRVPAWLLNERRARIANGHGRDIRRNGTYLVFRQLEQDVPAFNAFVSDVAEKLGETKEWVAARLLGRWREGEPLVAEKPNGSEEDRKNNFLYYYEDRSGLLCPIGAHIRRANPRDSLGPDPETALRLSKMHRIIRRGRPYGERWEPELGKCR